MFQLMDIINTRRVNASTAPVITVIWCILCHCPSIKLWMYSSTALWGSSWGTLRKEWSRQRTSTKIRPFCSGRKLRWTHADIMLRSLTHLSVIKQVSATRLLSHLHCIIKISNMCVHWLRKHSKCINTEVCCFGGVVSAQCGFLQGFMMVFDTKSIKYILQLDNTQGLLYKIVTLRIYFFKLNNIRKLFFAIIHFHITL